MDNYNIFEMDDYGDSEQYKSELEFNKINILKNNTINYIFI